MLKSSPPIVQWTIMGRGKFCIILRSGMKPPIPTAVTLKMHPSFSSSLLNPPKSQGLLSGVTFQDQTLVSSSASRRGWRGRKPGWTLLLQCPVILYLPSVPLCSSDHADRRVVCNYSYWQKWEGTDARTSNLIAQSEHFALIIGPWRVGRVESEPLCTTETPYSPSQQAALGAAY